MNIGTPLPRHARYRPDHLAIVFEHHRLTFQAFNARVAAKVQRLHDAWIGDDFPRNVAGKTPKRVPQQRYAARD